MRKLSLKGYTTEKPPLTELKENERVLAGDARFVNPKRILPKKKPSILKRIFS